MITTVFKQVNYPLINLIQDIEMGEIGLPDIQRPFVWKNTKVRDLFDSMYKGFPVGHLLFWENSGLGSPSGPGIRFSDHQSDFGTNYPSSTSPIRYATLGEAVDPPQGVEELLPLPRMWVGRGAQTRPCKVPFTHPHGNR